ncbi:MAG: hypothetical protein GY757_15645, partial [bacterium]|nr:hypothetical protein [bacterium]
MIINTTVGSTASLEKLQTDGFPLQRMNSNSLANQGNTSSNGNSIATIQKLNLSMQGQFANADGQSSLLLQLFSDNKSLDGVSVEFNGNSLANTFKANPGGLTKHLYEMGGKRNFFFSPAFPESPRFLDELGVRAGEDGSLGRINPRPRFSPWTGGFPRELSGATRHIGVPNSPNSTPSVSPGQLAELASRHSFQLLPQQLGGYSIENISSSYTSDMKVETTGSVRVGDETINMTRESAGHWVGTYEARPMALALLTAFGETELTSNKPTFHVEYNLTEEGLSGGGFANIEGEVVQLNLDEPSGRMVGTRKDETGVGGYAFKEEIAFAPSEGVTRNAEIEVDGQNVRLQHQTRPTAGGRVQSTWASTESTNENVGDHVLTDVTYNLTESGLYANGKMEVGNDTVEFHRVGPGEWEGVASSQTEEGYEIESNYRLTAKEGVAFEGYSLNIDGTRFQLEDNGNGQYTGARGFTTFEGYKVKQEVVYDPENNTVTGKGTVNVGDDELELNLQEDGSWQTAGRTVKAGVYEITDETITVKGNSAKREGVLRVGNTDVEVQMKRGHWSGHGDIEMGGETIKDAFVSVSSRGRFHGTGMVEVDGEPIRFYSRDGDTWETNFTRELGGYSINNHYQLDKSGLTKDPSDVRINGMRFEGEFQRDGSFSGTAVSGPEGFEADITITEESISGKGSLLVENGSKVYLEYTDGVFTGPKTTHIGGETLQETVTVTGNTVTREAPLDVEGMSVDLTRQDDGSWYGEKTFDVGGQEVAKTVTLTDKGLDISNT